MNKSMKLNFDVDSVEEFQYASDARFTKVVLHAFSDGDNSHTQPVDLDDLKFSSETIYDVPIKVQFTNRTIDGIGSHSKDYFNVGFIPRTDNPIRFVKNEDNGKTFLTVDGIIWTGDSRNIIDIIKDSNNKKKVSVEMEVTDYEEEYGEKIKIKKFVFTAVCILSDTVSEACKGSDIQLKFSKDKEEFIKMNYAEDKIVIDNTKESAVGWNGSWTNPARKLYVPIMKQRNAETLLKEAYLSVGEDWETSPSTELKYPHHKIVDGKLVVSVVGVIAAYKRAAQQNVLRGEILRHIKKHNKELGLNLNFDFCEDCETEKEENPEMENEVVLEEEKTSENEVIEEVKQSEEVTVNESDEEQKMEADETDDNKEEDKDDHEDEDNHDEDEKEDDDEEEVDYKEKFEELKVKYEELETKYNELSEKNKSCMSEYEELKEYKRIAEEEKAKEALEKIKEKTFSDLSEKGYEVSLDEKEKLCNKIQEFSETDYWVNYVKAYAFDNVKHFENAEIIKGIVEKDNNADKVSIWD